MAIFSCSKYFWQYGKKELSKAKKATYKNFYLIGKELNELGINFNCAPVLDLFVKNSNVIIGSRAFSKNK